MDTGYAVMKVQNLHKCATFFSMWGRIFYRLYAHRGNTQIMYCRSTVFWLFHSVFSLCSC